MKLITLISLLCFLSITSYAKTVPHRKLGASPQGVPGRTAVTVGNASTLVIGANINRGYLIIQNQGSVTCQLVFGAAITGSEGLKIQTNQNYEPVEAFVKSAVYMKCPSNTTIEAVWMNW